MMSIYFAFNKELTYFALTGIRYVGNNLKILIITF